MAGVSVSPWSHVCLLRIKESGFPNAENACSRMACPPVYPQMSVDEARYVVESVRKALEGI